MPVFSWILMAITVSVLVFWFYCFWQVEDWIDEIEDDWLSGKIKDDSN